jgi:2-amino-4-hydroxy-6-hydroxymethyldihydropteridine diphosphokinase
MNSYIILLSSNSNAEQNMSEARQKLDAFFTVNTLFSDNMRTLAVSKDGHPLPSDETAFYLNAVCQTQSDRPLDEVQTFLKQLETDMGRIRGTEAQGHVAIDLDLVEWNGEVLRPKDANQAYYKVCMGNLKNR